MQPSCWERSTLTCSSSLAPVQLKLHFGGDISADCLSPPGGPPAPPSGVELLPLGGERQEEVTELCGEKTAQQIQGVTEFGNMETWRMSGT